MLSPKGRQHGGMLLPSRNDWAFDACWRAPSQDCCMEKAAGRKTLARCQHPHALWSTCGEAARLHSAGTITCRVIPAPMHCGEPA